MEPVANATGAHPAASIEQAAAVFAQIRHPSQQTDTLSERKPAVEAAEAEPEAEASDDAADAIEADAVTAAEDGVELVETGEVDEQPAEEQPLKPSATTKFVDPDTGEIATWGEISKGRLRHKDYTQKTQELSAMRRQVEEFNAGLLQAQQYLAQKFEEVERLVPLEAEPDWVRLAEDDPLEAIRARARWDQKARVAQQARGERERLNQLRQAQEAQAQQARLAQLAPMIPEAIPAWRDPKVAKAEKTEIRKYMTEELGLPPEFDFTEVWMVRGIRDAWLGHKAQRAAATVRDKVKAAPTGPVLKPGTVRTSTDLKTARGNAAMAQLLKTNTADSAAGVFAAMRAKGNGR
jgi:hypothetical protein